MTIGHGIGQTFMQYCPIQQICRPRRKRTRFGMRKFVRLDQMQFVQPHRFHCPRSRADISGMLRADKNDSQGGFHRHILRLLACFERRLEVQSAIIRPPRL